MKMRLLFLALALSPLAAAAADTFPGLKAVMTPQEFASAGLDKLLPIQIEVIDAAIARHYNQSVHQEAAKIAEKSAKPSSNAWIHFGLPNLQLEWRDLPPLKAHVTAWAGGNRFTLDNGQVWEGTESIPYELPGKDIEIAPRPLGEFALVIEGQSTGVRVRRVK